VGAVGPGFSCDARTGSLPALELAPVVSGLDAPVAVVSPPGRPDTLFIVEQSGTIRIFDAGQLEATPFLDVQGLVRFGGEEGLLGLAFHPDYADNGRFFIHYSAATDGASTVMEYARSASNPNLADPTPVQLVVQTPTAQTNNNGGDVEFGGDGYLYVALGDGGAQNDPGCDAQNLQNFLGKILRLDVDGTPDQNGYPAAPGNPVGQKFYHVGLRNPWRLSFDRCTQDLYIGDVGQDTWEEVDVAPSASGALNFGWPMREGLHAHTNDCVSPPSNVVEPIAEFEHLDGRCSIIGGHVYRGSAIPSLRGSYICGDFCNGAIYSLRYDSGSVTSGPTLQSIQVGSQALSAFGQDGNGEIYVVDHGGSITRIAPN
jgi:glucose/arabinose dehydrogenase